MGVSPPLLSAAGILAAVIAMMVDGRRAVAIAVVFLAAGMAPTAATFGGAPGVAVLGVAALAAVLLSMAGWAGGRLLPWLAGRVSHVRRRANGASCAHDARCVERCGSRRGRNSRMTTVGTCRQRRIFGRLLYVLMLRRSRRHMLFRCS